MLKGAFIAGKIQSANSSGFLSVPGSKLLWVQSDTFVLGLGDYDLNDHPESCNDCPTGQFLNNIYFRTPSIKT